MSEFYSKENRELVEKMNLILGMNHRSKPYDLKDIDDAKEAFTKTVAEYIDYQKYYYQVSSVFDAFDESLEYYDPVTWFALSDEVADGDLLSIETDSALRKVDGCLYKLSQRAEDKCRNMLIFILEQKLEFQKALFGKAYSYTEESLVKIFEDSVDIVDTYSIEESRDAFLEIVDKHLEIKE